MDIQSYQFELYGKTIDIPASRVFANSVYKKFNRVEKKWHKRIVDDFYTIFDNLDDVYQNSDKLAQDVLIESVNVALCFLVENSIYDIDEKSFVEEHLSKYEIWDQHFELVASQFEAIIEETAQKDAYRTQRRLNRSKLVGFGPVPSQKNGYRSAQSYANFSNAVDNIGHGIFNMMAKGVTAIGNSIKKDKIFKNQKTHQALDSAAISIILASRSIVIAILNERVKAGIKEYTSEDVQKVSAILINIENGRIPECNIQREVLNLFSIYPYDEKIYKYLLTKFGVDDGNLDKVADYFGISILESEKEKIFLSKLNDINLSTVAAIESNTSFLSDFAKNIGYSEYKKDLQKVLDAARENEFQQEVAKFQLRTPSECDKNLAILEERALEIGYSHFTDWAAQVREKINIKHRTIDGIEYLSQFNADYVQKQSKILQDDLGRRGFRLLCEVPYNKGKVIQAANYAIKSSKGMKLVQMNEAAGILDGKSSMSLLSWGESFRVQIEGEEEANSAVLVIQSESRSSFAGTNRNKAITNALAEQILMILESDRV